MLQQHDDGHYPDGIKGSQLRRMANNDQLIQQHEYGYQKMHTAEQGLEKFRQLILQAKVLLQILVEYLSEVRLVILELKLSIRFGLRKYRMQREPKLVKTSSENILKQL